MTAALIVMLKHAHKLLPLLFVSFTLVPSAGAQALDSETRARMEREVTRLLLERDVTEVANQLEREGGGGTVALLRRLSVFGRAGHRARFLQTLEQLAEATDLPPVSHRWLVADVVKEIIGSDDLAALKVYCERIMPVDASVAENLVRLWEAEGERRELDKWLAARVEQNSEWLQWRIRWRVKLGTVNELLDKLAADVKANPGDLERAFLYLRANDAAGRTHSTAWLDDYFEAWLNTEDARLGAYELYELGGRLLSELPTTAAKMFERSLAVPFTERDMQLIRERVIVRFQVPPRVGNWEKQLRFWTKLRLAETYRTTNQPQKAQPLVEELVSMKGDDIIKEDVHRLAGAVQAGSGARVVEAKILREEAGERERAAYWMERARYYAGRKEHAAAMETYRRAFEVLPVNPQDRVFENSRLSLLMAFARYVVESDAGDDAKRKALRAELKQVLRREFAATPPETPYAFGVARIIVDNEFELDDLRDALLVEDKDRLARLLAARNVWSNEEKWLIEKVVCRASVAPQRRASIWAQLEALTKSADASRSFRLAEVMLSCNEARRAVPLFLDFLRQLKESPDEGAAFWTEQATRDLFRAYLAAGDWRAAEHLLPLRDDPAGRLLTADLSIVAVVAARSGAVDDALRLWRKKANLDRRQLDGLSELAATKAKEPLREMYTAMKKQDPLSSAPDAALKLLQ